MLSFLPGISIKFERDAFKVEKSRKVYGAVCQSGLFRTLCLHPSSINSNSRAGAPARVVNAMRAKNYHNAWVSCDATFS